MFPQREFLIERLNAARQALDALLPNVPTDKYIYPNWTIKEYLDHLSAWDATVVEALHAHASGEPVRQTAARGINSYNAQAVTERKTMDLEGSKHEFHTSRMAVIQALKDLPDAKFNEPFIFPWGEYGTVAYFIEIFVEHDEHHTKHLAEWFKNPTEAIREH